MTMERLGTVKGKMKKKGSSSEKRIGGCWIKSSKTRTYTDKQGEFSISDVPGDHVLEFVDEFIGQHPSGPGKTLALQAVTIEENAVSQIEDVDCVICQDTKPDPPGYVTGTARKKNQTTVKIAGVRIYTKKSDGTPDNYGDTYSDAVGKYCLARPEGNYQMFAEHPYYTWDGAHIVQIKSGDVLTVPINMTLK
jgi:hypothetical protein